MRIFAYDILMSAKCLINNCAFEPTPDRGNRQCILNAYAMRCFMYKRTNEHEHVHLCMVCFENICHPWYCVEWAQRICLLNTIFLSHTHTCTACGWVRYSRANHTPHRRNVVKRAIASHADNLKIHSDKWHKMRNWRHFFYFSFCHRAKMWFSFDCTARTAIANNTHINSVISRGDQVAHVFEHETTLHLCHENVEYIVDKMCASITYVNNHEFHCGDWWSDKIMVIVVIVKDVYVGMIGVMHNKWRMFHFLSSCHNSKQNIARFFLYIEFEWCNLVRSL